MGYSQCFHIEKILFKNGIETYLLGFGDFENGISLLANGDSFIQSVISHSMQANVVNKFMSDEDSE
jgi:hypothetical protein